MGIEYYVGTGGPTITVENADDLYEAVDLLHTQIMDTCCDDELMRILSETMDRIDKARECATCGGVGYTHGNGSTACGGCGGTGRKQYRIGQ